MGYHTPPNTVTAPAPTAHNNPPQLPTNFPGANPATPFIELETIAEVTLGAAVITTVGPPIPPASVIVDVVVAEPEVVVDVASAMEVAGGPGVVYARTYDISKYALSYFGLPGPTTLSLYCHMWTCQRC